MVNIIHRIGVKAPLPAVLAAVSTAEGISQWWTGETSCDPQQENKLHVRFRDLQGILLGAMSFPIAECTLMHGQNSARVRWAFESGPAEWVGTEASFDLKQEGEFTIVLFGHNHWREAVEFTAHCSMKWATFLLSLRAFLETGTGRPSPGDLKIDDWN